MRRLFSPPVVVAVIMVALASPALTFAATAHEQYQTLLAPFSCGTEWSGVTRAGHGLNDWNLDLNRTSRPLGDPDHDLGQPILAQADGTVVFVGDHASAGTYIEIDYGDITARYVHLVDDSIPRRVAEVGALVALGETVGLLGDSGNATHAHLHLEYFDSRDLDDTAWWQLGAGNQIQIVIDGEPIEPGEVFVSTNCGGDTVPTSTTTTSTTTSTTTTTTSTTTTTTTTTTVAPGPPTPHPFDDVEPSSFAYLDTGLLHDLGITIGTGPGTYSPADDVTREQMAAFLARLWRLTEPDALPPTEPHPFDDVDPTSFAHDDIHLLAHLGVTTGTGPGTYSPADDVTREQMAAFLARLIRAGGLS